MKKFLVTLYAGVKVPYESVCVSDVFLEIREAKDTQTLNDEIREKYKDGFIEIMGKSMGGLEVLWCDYEFKEI